MEQRHACYINNMIFVVSSCCIRSAEWVPVPWGDRKWFVGGAQGFIASVYRHRSHESDQ